jgi:hypothetical protein
MPHGTVIEDSPSRSATSGGECDDHDRVIDRDLQEGEPRVALAQLRPHEDHRGAGRCCEQNQSGDVAVELVCGQPSSEYMPHEDPAEQGHRERLDEPVHQQGHADAAPMATDLRERGGIDLDQHRNDHHSDQHAHGEVDL